MCSDSPPGKSADTELSNSEVGDTMAPESHESNAHFHLILHPNGTVLIEMQHFSLDGMVLRRGCRLFTSWSKGEISVIVGSRHLGDAQSKRHRGAEIVPFLTLIPSNGKTFVGQLGANQAQSQISARAEPNVADIIASGDIDRFVVPSSPSSQPFGAAYPHTPHLSLSLSHSTSFSVACACVCVKSVALNHREH